MDPPFEPSASSRHLFETQKTPLFWKPPESLDKYELADPYRNKRSTMVLRQSALQTATDRANFARLQRLAAEFPFCDVMFGKKGRVE